MADELSELNFNQDFEGLTGVPGFERLKIEKTGPLEIHVTIFPEKNPSELFIARLLWEKYPDDPPSLKFLDSVSESYAVPAAWPLINGYRPLNLDACVNWVSEGFITHPEWKDDPDKKWLPIGNSIIKVLRRLQNDFDERYQGRYHA